MALEGGGTGILFLHFFKSLNQYRLLHKKRNFLNHKLILTRNQAITPGKSSG